ncbi:hypothetical protein PTTW11_03384 [Pyrenophora teres f. teres]|uniref:Uncharacterized protein n=1 Tax=Pyrenophora teres f. teres TaxID=97479 RepID=A0A6S6VX54_9PLEO|nr:hypothetical protein PTTW11_03384 [Pyrenophora teres f. teres]
MGSRPLVFSCVCFVSVPNLYRGSELGLPSPSSKKLALPHFVYDMEGVDLCSDLYIAFSFSTRGNFK